MKKSGIRGLSLGAVVAFGLLALPVRITSASEGFVEANDACGEGVGYFCYPAMEYICAGPTSDIIHARVVFYPVF